MGSLVFHLNPSSSTFEDRQLLPRSSVLLILEPPSFLLSGSPVVVFRVVFHRVQFWMEGLRRLLAVPACPCGESLSELPCLPGPWTDVFRVPDHSAPGLVLESRAPSSRPQERCCPQVEKREVVLNSSLSLAGCKKPVSASGKEMDWAQMACHRCLVYLGDLCKSLHLCVSVLGYTAGCFSRWPCP